MAYDCQLIEQAPRPTLAIRTRTSVRELPQVLGGAFGAVVQYLGQAGEFPAGPPYVAYYNMDMENLDVEIGFPVNRALPGKETIKASEFPGGKVATVLHAGPYDQCRAAYEALAKWMSERGYEPTGVAYEVYLNDPQQTPPQELLTQIVFPLKTA